MTLVNVSGDSPMTTPNLGPDYTTQPYYFVLGPNGGMGYTLNDNNTVSSFSVSTSLQSNAVQQTALPANTTAVSIYSDFSFTYVAENSTDVQSTGVGQYSGLPLSLKQTFPAPSGQSPVYIVGIPNSARAYIINQAKFSGTLNNDLSQPGQIQTIETATSSVDTTPITVGAGPVYGVMTADQRRAFILNKTDGTVSVINVPGNVLDAVPPLAGSATSNNPISLAPGTNPVWADLAPSLNELVVLNQGGGSLPGTGSVTIISIPLCNATSLPSNPKCDPNNPVDAADFGTILTTPNPITVGANPVMVAVLQDGSKAYVLNEGDSTVSVISLTTNTVVATVPVPQSPNPTWIAATTGEPTGKVYVTSPNSNTMTVITTQDDQIHSLINLQGAGMGVRVTVP